MLLGHNEFTYWGLHKNFATICLNVKFQRQKIPNIGIKLNVQHQYHLDSLVQACSNSTANAQELLQSCTKPSIFLCCKSSDDKMIPYTM